MKNNMRVAIIGGGIVGSTAAFYFSQTEHDVVLYDLGTGQATTAAAGIICPWFSKRRNKAWYRLANGGAHFYGQLLQDLTDAGLESQAYQRKTTWLLKKDPKQIEELIDLANRRKIEAPLIGEITKLSPAGQRQVLPGWQYDQDVIQAEGAAVVDGEQLCIDLQTMAAKNKVSIRNEKALIEEIRSDVITINGEHYDTVVLACGAWLKEILCPHGYQVDVRAQKGQLAVYNTAIDTDAWPLIIPEGEGDVIPHHAGTLFIGATHEDDKDFDLTVDADAVTKLFASLKPYIPGFNFSDYDSIKVGSRAYTRDYAPFFGRLYNNKHILAASGLGSSGLTTGPLIGYNLVQIVLGNQTTLTAKAYATEKYVY